MKEFYNKKNITKISVNDKKQCEDIVYKENKKSFYTTNGYKISIEDIITKLNLTIDSCVCYYKPSCILFLNDGTQKEIICKSYEEALQKAELIKFSQNEWIEIE